MLLEHMPENLAKPHDRIWTTSIMSYELGSLIRALIKSRNRDLGGDQAGANAYLAEARVEFADLVTQCHVLAEQMGWKWLEIENEGSDRFFQRMSELAELE